MDLTDAQTARRLVPVLDFLSARGVSRDEPLRVSKLLNLRRVHLTLKRYPLRNARLRFNPGPPPFPSSGSLFACFFNSLCCGAGIDGQRRPNGLPHSYVLCSNVDFFSADPFNHYSANMDTFKVLY